MLINADWSELQATLEELLQQELVDQGHKLTGALSKSIETVVAAFGSGVSIDIKYFQYGAYLDQGVSASRIPFSGGAGRVRGPGGKGSAFIEGLKRFVRLRKMTSGLESEVTAVAFAIANKMKKEGMPTRGSYRYTNNGRRKQWVEYTLTQGDGKILEIVDRIGFQYILETFDELIFDLLRTSPV